MENLLAAAQVSQVSVPLASTGTPGFIPAPSEVSAGTGFSDMVTRGLGEVNGQLMTNQSDLQALALGDAQNLHQIMIRLEESRVSFQLLLQVRNRLLEAYQDVMKMPV